jgi:formylglycine-generating enzyme required for sulfatase activity
MGSRPTEVGRRNDETSHRVVISHPFYLSETEITQRQWLAVMKNNPSWFKVAGLDSPVENVSWNEIQEFLERLSVTRSGRYRLPTEAEWEYACRAGTTTPYNVGERILTSQANFDEAYAPPGPSTGSPRGAPVPVRSFQPNRWGLYDMHGNVWEWCADEYCAYGSAETTDPFNRCESPYKVIRGGSWYFGADSARSALRYTHEPQLRGFSIGFRVVREAD